MGRRSYCLGSGCVIANHDRVGEIRCLSMQHEVKVNGRERCVEPVIFDLCFIAVPD